MTLTTRELEPFNTGQVDNQEAATFMRRLTGKEGFTFAGATRPIALMIYDLKFAYPRHSYAHGFLLSIGAGEFLRLCERSTEPTMEPIMKRYVIGKLHMEMGGTIQGINVTAELLDLSRSTFDYSQRRR